MVLVRGSAVFQEVRDAVRLFVPESARLLFGSTRGYSDNSLIFKQLMIFPGTGIRIATTRSSSPEPLGFKSLLPGGNKRGGVSQKWPGKPARPPARLFLTNKIQPESFDAGEESGLVSPERSGAG